MNASRTPTARVIDWSASNIRGDGAEILQRHIVAYVFGVKGRRRSKVPMKSIVQWFSATPAEFVVTQIDALVDDNRIAKTTMRNGNNRFEVT